MTGPQYSRKELGASPVLGQVATATSEVGGEGQTPLHVETLGLQLSPSD